MKYLKTYKIFESSIDDVLDDIKDILLEIEDIGLTYKISEPFYISTGTGPGIKDGKKKTKCISIHNSAEIRKYSNKWSDVKDCVLRLIEYLEINNIKIIQILIGDLSGLIHKYSKKELEKLDENHEMGSYNLVTIYTEVKN